MATLCVIDQKLIFVTGDNDIFELRRGFTKQIVSARGPVPLCRMIVTGRCVSVHFRTLLYQNRTLIKLLSWDKFS